MPIYEYRCGACGHDHEALQKMTDSPLRKCPSCGKSQLRRLISAPSFRLKGAGWYETDFKRDGEKKRNLVESGGGESSESSSSSESSKDSASKEASAKIAETKSAGSETKKAKPAKASAPAKKPARAKKTARG